MLGKKKWVALVRGNNWIVAKVARRKLKLNILKLAEFKGGHEDSRVQKLKEWLRTNKVPLKKLNIAYSCPGVITRIITLPELPVKDLDTLLTKQVDQYFTLNIDDYLVDYRVLEHFEEDGQKRMRVLLAALPKYQWEKSWETWREVGFTPKVVDLAADSLARLYKKLDEQKDKLNNDSTQLQDIVIVDLAEDRVEFVFLEKGVFFLYSDIAISLAMLRDYADTWTYFIDKHGRNGNPESQEGTGELNPSELTETWVQSEMTNVLQPVFHTLAEFFHFFATRHFGKSIDCIYLTGDYSNLPFIAGVFEQSLEVQTKVGFPQGWQPSVSRKAGPNQDWMKYGSLYGLAFRED